jgi:methionyl-tRNA synthetase
VNSELVSIFGNFVNRVAVLAQKYYGGLVPENPGLSDEKLVLAKSNLDRDVESSLQKMNDLLAQVKLRDAQAEWMNVARAGNKFLAETEPWKLVKTDEQSVKAIMFAAIQVCAKLAVSAGVFLPHTAKKLAGIINLQDFSWELLNQAKIISSGTQMGAAEILYKPVEDAEIETQLNRLSSIKAAQLEQPKASSLQEVKSDIVYEDFEKIDLEAERVPKADKLLKLTVDLGFEKRTILSGIAEYYKPEELVGKLVTVVANLAPRKIRGIESQGMLLMAGNDFGKLFNVGPENDIEPGSVVK